MFIRRTATRNQLSGDAYITYRLVRSERIDKKVRQVTLLNLGRQFDLPAKEWPTLCVRIAQIGNAQASLAPLPVSARVERLAQHYAAQLVTRAPSTPSSSVRATQQNFHEVAVDSLEQLRPRSVGVEHVALHAMAQLGFTETLSTLGFNGKLKQAAIANVIGRMAQPGSEQATWRWLTTHSALGELLAVDFEAHSAMTLYRASDELIKHRAAIESRMFQSVHDLFGLQSTVTLYDLTNTYFEGSALNNPKAARGRSKEKRSDCPLVTLALVLNGSGFIERSRLFAGNVTEVKTLQAMLSELATPAGALVVMDAGIASAANIEWLIAQGFGYLVVSRKRTRQFNAAAAIEIKTASKTPVKIERVASTDGTELRLYCYSSGREQKEVSIARRWCDRFEQGMQKLSLSLAKPRGEKRLGKINERIGRLKEKSRVGQHYDITLTADARNEKAIALTFKRQPIDGTLLTHPGVYCLRTNQTTWTEQRLWTTYTMLTDLEAVFRSLKSELGLRPIYHHKESRTDGHLFISVLAYQLVQSVRRQLKEKDIHLSWSQLRETLSIQRRVTASFKQRDGRTLNVRKSTLAEPDLKVLYDALSLDPAPGGTRKYIGS